MLGFDTQPIALGPNHVHFDAGGKSRDNRVLRSRSLSKIYVH